MSILLREATYNSVSMAVQNIDTARLESTLKTLPTDVQDKIRGLATAVSNAPQSSSEEVKGQSLAHCLECLRRGDLNPMLEEIKAGRVKYDQADEVGNPLLHIALWRDDVPIVKDLLPLCPIDLRNSRGQTPLHLACARGALPLIKLFLDHGADIEARDQYNYSHLLTALQSHRLLAFVCLLQRGADVKCTDINGSNLVHWAANGNDIEFLRLLKELKVPFIVRNNFGLTPLHMACQGNAAEAYWFLVDEGLDPNELSKENKSPMDELIRFHEQAGVKRLQSVRAAQTLKIDYFVWVYAVVWVGIACAYYGHVINYTAQYLVASLLFNTSLICLPLLYL